MTFFPKTIVAEKQGPGVAQIPCSFLHSFFHFCLVKLFAVIFDLGVIVSILFWFAKIQYFCIIENLKTKKVFFVIYGTLFSPPVNADSWSVSS